MGYPWDPDGEALADWESVLASAAEEEVGRWVEWREEDEGYSLHRAAREEWTGHHPRKGEAFPGGAYYQSADCDDEDLKKISASWDFDLSWS